MNANTEHWRILDDLFQHASEMDASLREDFLRDACGKDAELRGELDALLVCVDRTLGWLKRPVDSVAREVALVGRRVGSYVLLCLLGEGGMGRVFLAARADEQYQQLAALKLMHADLGCSQIMLERFRAERQILANLNHSNIAGLIDGGMTSEGTPYLVMEYVKGVPLDEYCHANKIAVEKKLELFLRICSAVEYAHKNLVVHRDIKPANVLVGEDGNPKLVDFGIAKLLEPESSAAAEATTTLMTPEFASPEQLRGEPITTATDVYGLGVLLYHLLSGASPFLEHSGNPVEMMRRICEVEPPPPSSKLSNRERRWKSERDLDRIVLMAMQKEPERRYPSATAFARDVFAYLNGYPVFARGGGWRYRAGKFLRRHKLPVAALTFIAVGLAVFGVGMGVLKQKADRERLKAERTATFLADMFRAATPREARGRTITARELLDRGSERVEKELAGEPEIQASLLYSIADAYARLGFYGRGRDLAERSYKIRRQVSGPRNSSTAESLVVFANLTRLKGDYAHAEPLFREALELQRGSIGKESITVANTLNLLGECLFLEGKDSEAESDLRRALAIFRTRGANAGSITRDYLARLLERKGDYPEAAELLNEAVEIDKHAEGADSPDYAISLHNYAGALWRLGDLYSAEAKLNESLAIERRILGAGHPDLGYPLNLLGGVALDLGDWRKAEPLLRESFEIWSRLDSNNVLVVSAFSNRGRILQAQGRYSEARVYLQRALDTAQHQAGSAYTVSRVLYNFALLEFDDRHYSASEEKASQALSMALAVTGGATAPDTAVTMIALAEAKVFQGDPAGAEPILRRSLKILKNKLPARNPSMMTTEIRLGEALTAEGNAAGAEPILREALASAYAPPFRIPAWLAGEAESALGWCLATLGRTQDATRLLQQSQQKLVNDPRPLFRKQAAAHLETLLQAGERH